MDIRTTFFGDASNFFGPPTGDALLSAGLANAVDANALIVASLQRDLDRLNGYRVDLPPSQKEELASLQDQIGRINERVRPDGTLSTSDADERAKLYRDAYKILGKDYVEVKSDKALSELMEKVDKLLEPRLQGEQKARLERLRALEASQLASFEPGKTSASSINYIRNIQAQIRELTPPRKMNQLSVPEKADYNRLVNQINTTAGTDLLLNSVDREKAEKIQETINQFGG
jgi:hypothetical protein